MIEPFARMARFYGFRHEEMEGFTLPLFTAYLENIEPLRAEENLIQLAIANDPKPMWQIDYKKSKGHIGKLFEKFKQIASGGSQKPYYEVLELDREGLRRLKEQMEGARERRKDA